MEFRADDAGITIRVKERGAGPYSGRIPEHFPSVLREEFQKTAEKKREERIEAWLLLERMLADRYGIKSLAELDIRRTAQGKPYGQACPQIRFNISHCPAAYACIAAEREAGIDVERKFPWKGALARRVCHPEEWAYMRTLEDTRREAFLQLLWSAKESVVKMTGDGLGYGMNRVNLIRLLADGPDFTRTVPDSDKMEETDCRHAEADQACGPEYTGTDRLCVREGELDGIGPVMLLFGGTKHYTLAACVRRGGEEER